MAKCMKNKVKRFLSLLLSVCMLAGILPAASIHAAANEPGAQVVAQQLSLGDDLKMRYFVAIDDTLAQNAVMNITVSGNTRQYPVSTMTANADGNYIFNVKLPAAQMTDNIKLSLMNGQTEVLSKTYSVRSYAKVLLDGTYDSTVKAMAKTMLNYGAKAQLYFDYRTDDLANTGYALTEEAAVPGTALEIEQSGSVSGVSFYGASLVFQNQIALRYYFRLSDSSGLTFQVGDTAYPAVAKGELYYVEVPGINPQDYAKIVNLSISNGTETMTVGYSPMHYITRKCNSSAADPKLTALLSALYTYHQAAVAYVNGTVQADYFAGDFTFNEYHGTVGGQNIDAVKAVSSTPQAHFHFTDAGVNAIKAYAAANNMCTLTIHAYADLYNNSFVLNNKTSVGAQWQTMDVRIEELSTDFDFWSKSDGTSEVYLWFEYKNSLQSQLTLGSNLSAKYYSDGEDAALEVGHNQDYQSSSEGWGKVGLHFNLSDQGENTYVRFTYKIGAIQGANNTYQQIIYIYNGNNISLHQASSSSVDDIKNRGCYIFDAETGKEVDFRNIEAGKWYDFYVKVNAADCYILGAQTSYSEASEHPEVTCAIKNIEFVNDLRFEKLQSQITLGASVASQSAYSRDGKDEMVTVWHKNVDESGRNAIHLNTDAFGSAEYVKFMYKTDALSSASAKRFLRVGIGKQNMISVWSGSGTYGTREAVEAYGMYIYDLTTGDTVRAQDMEADVWYEIYLKIEKDENGNAVGSYSLAAMQEGKDSIAAENRERVAAHMKNIQYVTERPVNSGDVQYMSAQGAADYAQITAEAESKYVTYYFAADGDDGNSGLRADAPLKTVAKANEIIAKAGKTPTKIAFKAGDAFACEYTANDPYKKGELYIFGHNAQEETPLIVTSYGETETAKYAKLYPANPSASGAPSEIVYIGESNTRVSNLELTGEKTKLGVRIYSAWGTETAKGGAMKNIVVSDCYIHDIFVNYTENPYEEIRAAYAEALKKKEEGVFDYMPDPSTDFNNNGSSMDEVRSIIEDGAFTYSTGGIVMGTGTSAVNGPTWLENVWIENNTIERVARCGMFLSAGWARRPGWDNGAGSYYYDEETGEEKGYYPNENVVVRGNNLDYTGGDGIVLLNSRNSFVENNVSYHAQYLGRDSQTNGQAAFSVPIWVHSCTNVVMQYNEAAYCFTENGSLDGQGFDIDIGNRNIIFRYNYSHHNAGGGILITNRSTTDFVYDENGDKVTEANWYDMNVNLVTADDENNKGLPLRESRYILLENIYVQNNVFAYNDVRVFNIAGPTKNLQITNNTVLLDGETRPNGAQFMLLQSEDMAGTGVRAKDWLFANNIFYQLKKQPVIFKDAFCDSCVVRNNVFYNFEDSFFDLSDESIHSPATQLFGNSREDPQLTATDAPIGIENARSITAQAAYLNDLAVFELNMQSEDMAGSNVKGVKYVGAVCPVNEKTKLAANDNLPANWTLADAQKETSAVVQYAYAENKQVSTSGSSVKAGSYIDFGKEVLDLYMGNTTLVSHAMIPQEAAYNGQPISAADLAVEIVDGGDKVTLWKNPNTGIYQVAAKQSEGTASIRVSYVAPDGGRIDKTLSIVLHPAYLETGFVLADASQGAVYEDVADTSGIFTGRTGVKKYMADPDGRAELLSAGGAFNLQNLRISTDRSYENRRLEVAEKAQCVSDMYRAGYRYFAYDVYVETAAKEIDMPAMPLCLLGSARDLSFNELLCGNGIYIIQNGQVTNRLAANGWMTVVFDLYAIASRNLDAKAAFYFAMNDKLATVYLDNIRYYFDSTVLPNGGVAEYEAALKYEKQSDGSTAVVGGCEFVPYYSNHLSVEKASSDVTQSVAEQNDAHENAYLLTAHTAGSWNSSAILVSSIADSYYEGISNLRSMGKYVAFDMYVISADKINFRMNHTNPSALFDENSDTTQPAYYWIDIIDKETGQLCKTFEKGVWQTVVLHYNETVYAGGWSPLAAIGIDNAGGKLLVDNVRYLPSYTAPTEVKPFGEHEYFTRNVIGGAQGWPSYYRDENGDLTLAYTHNKNRNVYWSEIGIKFNVKDNIGDNNYLKFSFKFDALADSTVSQTMFIFNKGANISAANWASNGVICYDEAGNALSYSDLQAGQWYDLYVKITDKTGNPGQYYVAFYQTDYDKTESHPNVTAYVKNVAYVSSIPYEALRSKVTVGSNLSSAYQMDGGDDLLKVWHNVNHESQPGWGNIGLHFNLADRGDNQYVKFTYKVDAIQGAEATYPQVIFIYNGNNISLYKASGNNVNAIKDKGCYIYEAGTATEVDFHNLEAGKWYDFYVKINATGKANDCYVLGSQAYYGSAPEHPNVYSYIKNIGYTSTLPSDENT